MHAMHYIFLVGYCVRYTSLFAENDTLSKCKDLTLFLLLFFFSESLKL